jgi:hypothetical protein
MSIADIPVILCVSVALFWVSFISYKIGYGFGIDEGLKLGAIEAHAYEYSAGLWKELALDLSGKIDYLTGLMNSADPIEPPKGVTGATGPVGCLGSVYPPIKSNKDPDWIPKNTTNFYADVVTGATGPGPGPLGTPGKGCFGTPIETNPPIEGVTGSTGPVGTFGTTTVGRGGTGPIGDMKYTNISIDLSAGEDIPAGSIIYLKADGNVWIASVDTLENGRKDMAIFGFALHEIKSGQIGRIMLNPRSSP